MPSGLFAGGSLSGVAGDLVPSGPNFWRKIPENEVGLAKGNGAPSYIPLRLGGASGQLIADS
jgi:hypothetical protein